MATIPNDFFTVASFGTLAGCVAITTVVTGSLYKFGGWQPAKTGLIVAFAAVAAGLFLADELSDPKADIVGFFNAFLVYLSAAGASDRASGPVVRGDTQRRPFFRPWFR